MTTQQNATVQASAHSGFNRVVISTVNILFRVADLEGIHLRL
jgi:hypothetical protein